MSSTRALAFLLGMFLAWIFEAIRGGGIHMRMFILVGLLVALMSTAAQAGFPKSKNFMSDEGYARWQTYLATGRWVAR